MLRPRIQHRIEQILQALEWPLAILALAVVPALLLEDSSTATIDTWREGSTGSCGWRLWSSSSRGWPSHRSCRWGIRRQWLDLLIILVSPPFLVPDAMEDARTFRAFRLLRLLRAVAVAAIGVRSGRRVMVRQRMLFVGTIGLVTVCAGALAGFGAEAGTNGSIKTLQDAFWWAVVTATTAEK